MDLEKHYTQAFGGMRDVYPMRRDDSMSMKFKRQGSGRGYDNFMKFISLERLANFKWESKRR